MSDRQNVQNVQLIDDSETDENGNPKKSQPGVVKAGALGSSGVGKLSSSPSGQQVFSSAAAPSTPQQARSAQASGPAKGSGFTGVGRFLQANVGSRLGEQIAGRVAQAGQQAQQRLGEAVGRFQTGLGKEQGTFSAQEAAARGALQQFSGSQQPVQTGQAVDFNPSQEEIAAYLAASSGRYAGPSGLEDIEGVRSQAGLAQTFAGQTQTTKGRTALLQQLLGRGSQQYTRGQTALDALLLGQNSAQLAQSRRGAAGLEKRLETQEKLAEEQARQAGEQFASKGQALRQDVSAMEASQKAAVQSQLDRFQREFPLMYDKAKKELATGKVSRETLDVLSQFGIKEGSSLFGGDFETLASNLESSGPATFASSATKEQAAKLNALKRLQGMSDFFTKQDLESTGTTVDPKAALKMKDPDYLKKQEQAFKEQIEGIDSTLLRHQGVPEQYDPLTGTRFTPDKYVEGLDLSNVYKDGSFNYENGLQEMKRLGTAYNQLAREIKQEENAENTSSYDRYVSPRRQELKRLELANATLMKLMKAYNKRIQLV